MIFEEEDELPRQKVESEAPPSSLGSNLNTIEDAKRWLLHPSNWMEHGIDKLFWNGVVPKIKREVVQAYINDPYDDGIFKAAVLGQRRRKARGDKSEEEVPSGGD